MLFKKDQIRVVIKGDDVIKEYKNLSREDIVRLIEVYTTMSGTRLGPKVYSMDYDIEHGFLLVVMEKLLPMGHYLYSIRDKNVYEWPDRTEEIILLIERIRKVVQDMHDLDLAHGDLHIGNIGIREDDSISIFDLDTVFHISTSRDEEWVLRMMREEFGIEDYDEFVNYDLINWDTEIEDALQGEFLE